jgi:hypothetical protein
MMRLTITQRAALLLLLAAGYSTYSAAAAAAAAPAAAAPPANIPTCTWFAYDAKIPTAGYCTVSDTYYLTIPAQPSSFISKQLTRVFARHWLCNAATSEAACKGLQQQQQQQGLGCYWNGQRCDAKERSDWSWFSR